MALQQHDLIAAFPNPSVLMVEQREEGGDQYALALAGAGFSVRQVVSGEEALELVLERVPDVLVTEITLPGMSGATLCRHLRRLEIASEMKVLAVTERGTPQELEETTSAGFDAVLVKPYRDHELVSAVRQVLERGRELRDRSRAARAKAKNTAERTNRLHLQTKVFLAAAGIAGVSVPCPRCRKPLIWRETNRVNDIRFDYFQPCAHGCGEYLFDHLRRRLVMLRS